MNFKAANKALLQNGARLMKVGGRILIFIAVTSTVYEIYEVQKDPMGYWKSLKNNVSELFQSDKNTITNYERRIIELRK
jgi:hypothetical protein